MANQSPQKLVNNTFASLDKSAGFMEGTNGPILYAFHDLNCPSCAQFWQMTRQPINAGIIRVKWIPVAILGPTSKPKASSLLANPNPVVALAQHEAKIQSIPPSASAAAFEAPVDGNNALLTMVANGQPATPMLVTRGADGKPAIVRGLPTNAQEFFTSIR
jgi:thiol:disulfide interchange protein DsbG